MFHLPVRVKSFNLAWWILSGGHDFTKAWSGRGHGPPPALGCSGLGWSPTSLPTFALFVKRLVSWICASRVLFCRIRGSRRSTRAFLVLRALRAGRRLMLFGGRVLRFAWVVRSGEFRMPERRLWTVDAWVALRQAPWRRCWSGSLAVRAA